MRHLVEFRCSPDYLPDIGTQLLARHFVPGQYVDIRGKSTGKGFAGGMKRWGFKGMPASHGVSKTHRQIGATGSGSTYPGRVWKGKKMPGKMGNKTIFVRNLKVYQVDPLKNLIYVKGAVPGTEGKMVQIMDSQRLRFPEDIIDDVPVPTYFEQENESTDILAYEPPTDTSRYQ